MPNPTPRSERRHHGIEPLESRIAPAVTAGAIGQALDLQDGTAITISGNPASFATLKLSATGQLLGFPSGGDGDFLVLSTGIASQLTSLANTGSSQGTDLGPVGADGDSAAISFTLPVPQSAAGHQRFKLDFMFLTEEFPEFAGALANDLFTVTINGTNYAVDQQGHVIDVNSTFFTGAPATGTYFDGRTDKMTLTYAVPEGVTALNVEIRISDVGDGQVDSAVLVDNVRFQTQETVYLNFEGGELQGLFGPGIKGQIPAFKPEDLNSSSPRQDLINDIIAKLQSKYAAYDIFFTSEQPTYGQYGTVMIGGDNKVELDLAGANSLVQNRFPGGQASVTDLFGLGDDSLLGLAGAPDVGNLNHSDRLVVFAGEFSNFFAGASEAELEDNLVVTIAHELGHNLGLRHVTDANPNDVMSQTAPRSSSAVFGSSLLPLAEQWSDGTTEQNDHAYLLSILGGSDSSGTGLQATQIAALINFAPRLAQTLYDATIYITTGDSDAAGLSFHFDKLDGTQNLSLPLLSKDAKISIIGSSVPGGPADTFSGSPTNGHLTDADNFVSLFDANGNFASIPFTKQQAGGAFVAAGTVPVLANNLGDVTLIPGKVATFIDDDGDYYTVKLTGPGIIGYKLVDPDLNGHGPLEKLVMEGTTFGQSILTITVMQKGPNGDGRVDIGEISGAAGAGLKSIVAPMADLTGGGVVFTGALGAVNLHDLKNGADLIGGAADNAKTTIRLHSVGDGSEISLGTNVTSFQAARIGDASILLPSVTKFLITGDKPAGLAADFAGQIKIEGLLGSFTAGDLAGTASIEAGGSPLDRTILAMRSVADGAKVSLASAVTSLRATAIGDASFEAQQFDNIILTGSLGGDFTAIGKIGRLTATDLLGTASLTAGGLAKDKTTLVFHAVNDGASISLESSISVLRAARIGEVSITAASLGTLAITGDVRAGLAGDFLGTLTLEGGDQSFKNLLNVANIAGTVDGASISAESIGTFTALRVKDSAIYAGYTPVDPMHVLDGGVFFEGGSIKSFVLRSATAAFDNSFVASKSLGTIRVVSVDIDNGSTAFGFLTHAAPTRISVTGFTYDKAGPADQSVGDFHLRIV